MGINDFMKKVGKAVDKWEKEKPIREEKRIASLERKAMLAERERKARQKLDKLSQYKNRQSGQSTGPMFGAPGIQKKKKKDESIWGW